MSKLQKLGFNKPIKTMSPLEDKTRNLLRTYSSNFEEALRKGEEYRRIETKKFGGNPLPGEPGSEKYFRTI